MDKKSKKLIHLPDVGQVVVVVVSVVIVWDLTGGPQHFWILGTAALVFGWWTFSVLKAPFKLPILASLWGLLGGLCIVILGPLWAEGLALFVLGCLYGILAMFE